MSTTTSGPLEGLETRDLAHQMRSAWALLQRLQAERELDDLDDPISRALRDEACERFDAASRKLRSKAAG